MTTTRIVTRTYRGWNGGHGLTGYQRGCRCEECRSAKKAADRRPVGKHGITGYQKGCRCPQCRAAKYPGAVTR